MTHVETRIKAFKLPKLASAFSLIIGALVLHVPAAVAADYTFTRIADDGAGNNLRFSRSTNIAIDASGTVAFSAARTDSQGNITSYLILTGSGGQPTIIAESGSNIRFAYAYDINSSHTVLFGISDAGNLSLYTGSGAGISKVPTADGDTLTNAACINDVGTIAYSALSSMGISAIRIISNGEVRAVDPDASHAYLQLGQLNQAGDLVFLGVTPSATLFLAIDKGGAVTTLATEGSPLSLALSYFPALNDNGVVALAGNIGNQYGTPEIVKVDGTEVTTVVSGTGSYTPVNINNSGTVVYGIQGIGTLTGIYGGPDLAAGKVIAVGDDLFGSKVVNLRGPGSGPGRWLNDHGQVAFYYGLANGTAGVAVATPVAAALRSIEITGPSASLSSGTSEQFTATGNYGDGSTANLTNLVTWNSSNPSVATVSAFGFATANNQGATNISATLNGVTSKVFVLTVTPPILTSISITAPSNTVVAGSTLQFSATGTYSNGSTKTITNLVAWRSSNTSAAVIGAATGLASGVAAGSASIFASLAGVTSNQFSLTVVAPPPPVITAFWVMFGSQSYLVTGTSRTCLPWQVDGIQVVFSQPITSGTAASLGGIAATGFSGLGSNTLTWTFASLAVAHVSVTLAGSGSNALKNSSGLGLNGGAGATQSVKILWGDFDDDGAVSAADLVGVNNARAGAYDIFADTNGDGAVNATDVQAVRSRIGTVLP